MRRYIVGALAGAALTVSVSAAADSISLIGKRVQSEADVIQNGNVVDTAIVVDGKSYAPVRTTYEKAGYIVEYKGGKVYLSLLEMPQIKNDEDNLAMQKRLTIEAFKADYAKYSLKEINSKLIYYKTLLPKFEEALASAANDPTVTAERKFNMEWQIEMTKLQIEELERLKAEKENEDKDS